MLLKDPQMYLFNYKKIHINIFQDRRYVHLINEKGHLEKIKDFPITVDLKTLERVEGDKVINLIPIFN